MSAVISGVIGAVTAMGLAVIANRQQKSARLDAAGWKILRPNCLLHGTFVACVAFTALIAAFFLSGGSPRPDADTQNLSAAALGFIFASAAIYLGWINYARTVGWKGQQLRIRTIGGADTVRSLSNVESIRKSEMRGDYRLRFMDGSSVVFSAYMHGAKELVEQIARGPVEG